MGQVTPNAFCPHCNKATKMINPKEVTKEKFSMILGTCADCGNRSFIIKSATAH